MNKKITFLALLYLLILNTAYGSTCNSQISFLRNQGQWPSDILYQSTSTQSNIYFLQDGLSFARTIETEDSLGHDIYTAIVWNMKFLNQNVSATLTPDSLYPSVISYFIGRDTNDWVIHPMETNELFYTSVYQNIDLHFYESNNDIEYDYIIHPGGHANSIKNYFEGITPLVLNNSGDLEITTEAGTHVQRKPYCYQIFNGVQVPVNCDYIVLNDSTFAFNVTGNYNPNADLVIDPLFQFSWSTYAKAAGASNNINYCFSNATDLSGNVYITGMVDGTYPRTAGSYSGPGTIVPEIFVSKFSKNGNTLLYSTYISGSSSETGLDIAVDALGQAYITGKATANFTGGNTYPTTANAFQQNMFYQGGSDVVFSVLNAYGTGLVYSSFLGGDNDDEGYSIALGSAGLAYITGYTYSSGTTFPTKNTSNTSQQTSQGYHDAFVAKFNINLSGLNSLIYSVRLASGGDENGRSIAVNSNGNAFITGNYQEIGLPNFPLTSGSYNSTYNSGNDNRMVFVSKLSSTLPVTLDYSTLIAPGTGNGIAVNAAGNAFVTGGTSTFAFPVTSGVIQQLHGQDNLGNSNSDAFVVKLNVTGSALVYSTFLGGPGSDAGTGIAVNGMDEVYVTGMASPLFPTSSGAMQPNHSTGGGDSDFFLVQLNSTASEYGCGGSTYLGGNDMDYNSSMYDYVSPSISLLNHNGLNDSIVVSGTSHSTNFPTTTGSYSPVKINGIADQPVFAKLTCSVPLPVELLSFHATAAGDHVILEWSTASEINNDHFEVEKSTEGLKFQSLSSVHGNNTTTIEHNYSSIDLSPSKGINYYRLKQVDINEEFEYSDMVAVEFKNNPCAIKYYDSEKILGIDCGKNNFTEIYATDGQLIYKYYDVSEINITGLKKGMYFVKVTDINEGQIFKVEKIFLD